MTSYPVTHVSVLLCQSRPRQIIFKVKSVDGDFVSCVNACDMQVKWVSSVSLKFNNHVVSAPFYGGHVTVAM